MAGNKVALENGSEREIWAYFDINVISK